MGPPDRPRRRSPRHIPIPKVIAVVHAETSTGVRNDIAPLRELKGDALLLVDCVTSLGGIPVAIDEWGVDIAYSGTQKCLGVPPGLSPLTVSDRARERFVERSQSWYLDLRMISQYVASGGGPHLSPHGADLDDLRPARRPRRGARRRPRQPRSPPRGVRGAAAGRASRSSGSGCSPRRVTGCPSSRPLGCPRASTRPRCAAGCSSATASRSAAGSGAYAGKVWRIGCMGHTARVRNVTLLLGALEDCLSR